MFNFLAETYTGYGKYSMRKDAIRVETYIINIYLTERKILKHKFYEIENAVM